jgi:predicted nucleic acid-binding protein
MGSPEVKLVDTSSWIEFLRGNPSEPALRVKHLIETENAAWCDLIAVELWNGVRPGDETKALNELEKEATSFELSAAVWQRARKLAARSRKGGITVPTVDVVIAACAAHYGLEVEHFDSHFDHLMPIAVKL